MGRLTPRSRDGRSWRRWRISVRHAGPRGVGRPRRRFLRGPARRAGARRSRRCSSPLPAASSAAPCGRADGCVAVDADAAQFELVIGTKPGAAAPRARGQGDRRRSVLRAGTAQPVEVDGLFYREAGADAAGSAPMPLRAWLVAAGDARPPPPARDAAPATRAALVPLQDLVYGAGRYDGRLIRVRGSLPRVEPPPRPPGDGRRKRPRRLGDQGRLLRGLGDRARRPRRDGGTSRSRSSADDAAVVEVVGVPTTVGRGGADRRPRGRPRLRRRRRRRARLPA